MISLWSPPRRHRWVQQADGLVHRALPAVVRLLHRRRRTRSYSRSSSTDITDSGLYYFGRSPWYQARTHDTHVIVSRLAAVTISGSNMSERSSSHTTCMPHRNTIANAKGSWFVILSRKTVWQSFERYFAPGDHSRHGGCRHWGLSVFLCLCQHLAFSYLMMSIVIMRYCSNPDIV